MIIEPSSSVSIQSTLPSSAAQEENVQEAQCYKEIVVYQPTLSGGISQGGQQDSNDQVNVENVEDLIAKRAQEAQDVLLLKGC